MRGERKGYAVSPAGQKPTRRSLGDAIEHTGESEIAKDEMNGGKPESHEYLRMSEGNILEAHGRDVSNSKADVDGWGGEDAPYAGMENEGAPYGSGAGMRGGKPSRQRRE